MNKEDMMLISVDDHTVEPPDMFKNNLPKKYQDDAPRLVHNDDGSDMWKFRDTVIPNVALNAVAGRPKEEYGIEPTGARRDPAGLLQRRRAGQGHERRGRPGLHLLSVLPGLCRAPVRHRRPRLLDRAGAGLQRLAHRRVVRRLPGAIHPDGDPGDLGRRGMRGRGPAGVEEGRARADLHREPGRDGLPELPQRVLEPAVEGVVRHRHRHERAHRVLGPAGDHRSRCADGRDDHAAADEHRAGGRGPVVVAAHQGVPRPQDRALRGRHRVDPLLPGAGGPYLRDALDLDAPGLRWQGALRGFPRALPDLLHQRQGRRGAAQHDRHRQHLLGRPTTRTATRCGRARPRSCGTCCR